MQKISRVFTSWAMSLVAAATWRGLQLFTEEPHYMHNRWRESKGTQTNVSTNKPLMRMISWNEVWWRDLFWKPSTALGSDLWVKWRKHSFELKYWRSPSCAWSHENNETWWQDPFCKRNTALGSDLWVKWRKHPFELKYWRSLPCAWFHEMRHDDITNFATEIQP